MKSSLKFALALLAFSLTAGVASAIPYQIPGANIDIPKNGTGPDGGNGNSAADNFFRLQVQVASYNLANPSSMVPTPLSTGSFDISSNLNVLITGWDFIVLHYGSGPGGTSGGGIAIFYLNGMTGTFSFPSIGTGTNGNGGWSSGTLFHGTPSTPQGVPDGGTTLVLLGAALALIELLRRRLFKRSLIA